MAMRDEDFGTDLILTIEKDGKRVTTRTCVEGRVGRVLQAAGVALPPDWREHPA